MKTALRRIAAAVAVASGCWYAIASASSLGLRSGDEDTSPLSAGDTLVLGGRGSLGFTATIENAGATGIRVSSSIDGGPMVLLKQLLPGDSEDVAAWPGETVMIRTISSHTDGSIRVRYRTDDGGMLPIGMWPAGYEVARR